MKKITYLLLAVIASALIFSTSCTKLDEEIYDKIPANQYPENGDQVATLSVNAYKRLQNMADDNGWWFLAQEISSDELCAPTRGADWYDGGKWADMHTHRWTNDIEGVNRMWGLFWDGINECNNTILQLKAIGNSGDILKKIGELEVLRSYFYYLLIDN